MVKRPEKKFVRKGTHTYDMFTRLVIRYDRSLSRRQCTRQYDPYTTKWLRISAVNCFESKVRLSGFLKETKCYTMATQTADEGDLNGETP